MLPDLEQLIQLQRLTNTAMGAQRDLEAIPGRLDALNSQLTVHVEAVTAANDRLARKKTERQGVEKSLAEVQARLSRFKDQLMSVKTNKEYAAIQHEMATAEADVRKLEDAILEHMLEFDELKTVGEAAEETLEINRVETEQIRTAFESERTELERVIDSASGERGRLSETIGEPARQLFDRIAERSGGVAVVPAHNGHCTLCNVRLRPQVFNQILLNTTLIQCDSCKRILYHEPNSLENSKAPIDSAR
jgi:hypothetical protein